MAVLNCTPDSFSDGGRFLETETAVAHGHLLIEQGADIVDVGGESTRPGAEPVPSDEQLRRVLPVLGELRARHSEVLLSVDTSNPEVAEAALAAGADLVNDVTAASRPELLELAASHGAAVVLMHMRGTPRTMQSDTRYDDVVAEVHAYLKGRAHAALSCGIPPDRIWLDPGIGFGKDDVGNLRLLAAMPRLARLGHPVLVGASRKAFIGRLTGATVEARLPGSLAALIPVVGLPRVVVRVHDAAASLQFLELATQVREAAS
jgi:dihydropteroate synthase